MTAFHRAYNIKEFCKCFSIGRSKTYDEIKVGRLRAIKVGRRTLITMADAEEWLLGLPSSNQALTTIRQIRRSGASTLTNQA
ncbi:MAG: helix-turn-helix domain-containing protein [Tardiphaga sp.]|uniref:helix-turn-helix domain-containing protein n=1 Tax=Tardiphaga sp. TaxID=1926292 RepID=UPI0019B6698C|nr:helix-turn-helix domain-containing protein [Tardiphaga sp.]MBC7582343.1 helix-turn-helix domain-containing protein [Tardiphaga sp.]